ncbi:MAG: DUF29 domain-containing protein [Gloeocapsa sp. UFS-A4-WI-NPMV-4B04]|jgi:hypothetical protein|nr:DUF29 domain-containing protein [Gloeocapsa sp. UFS-A4-WI-NPMV-4B04]
MSSDLYKTDYDGWLEAQIDALEQGQFGALDIPHLIEELEIVNKLVKREMSSHLVTLLTHFLKWQYEPKARSGSWKGVILMSRYSLEEIIEDQSSLNNYWNEAIVEAYIRAREWAEAETEINIKLFPDECPYSVEQIRDQGWLPE